MSGEASGWLKERLQLATFEAGRRLGGGDKAELALAGLSALEKVREPLERLGRNRLEDLGSSLLRDANVVERVLTGEWDEEQAAVLAQLDRASLSRLRAYQEQQDWKAIFAVIGGGALEGVRIAFQLLSVVGL